MSTVHPRATESLPPALRGPVATIRRRRRHLNTTQHCSTPNRAAHSPPRTRSRRGHGPRGWRLVASASPPTAPARPPRPPGGRHAPRRGACTNPRPSCTPPQPLQSSRAPPPSFPLRQAHCTSDDGAAWQDTEHPALSTAARADDEGKPRLPSTPTVAALVPRPPTDPDWCSGWTGTRASDNDNSPQAAQDETECNPRPTLRTWQARSPFLASSCR